MSGFFASQPKTFASLNRCLILVFSKPTERLRSNQLIFMVIRLTFGFFQRRNKDVSLQLLLLQHVMREIELIKFLPHGQQLLSQSAASVLFRSDVHLAKVNVLVQSVDLRLQEDLLVLKVLRLFLEDLSRLLELQKLETPRVVDDERRSGSF